MVEGRDERVVARGSVRRFPPRLDGGRGRKHGSSARSGTRRRAGGSREAGTEGGFGADCGIRAGVRPRVRPWLRPGVGGRRSAHGGRGGTDWIGVLGGNQSWRLPFRVEAIGADVGGRTVPQRSATAVVWRRRGIGRARRRKRLHRGGAFGTGRRLSLADSASRRPTEGDRMPGGGADRRGVGRTYRDRPGVGDDRARGGVGQTVMGGGETAAGRRPEGKASQGEPGPTGEPAKRVQSNRGRHTAGG